VAKIDTRMLQLRFSDVKWHGVFKRLLNHVTTNVARLRFMFDRNLLSEDLRKLLRQPPIGGCSHKKGMGPYVSLEAELGEGGFLRPMVVDYNVYLHTFPDGRQRIRCNRCGETVWEGDAKWSAWLQMTQQSTNRASAAEQVIATGDDALRILKNQFCVTTNDPLWKRKKG
jgi:hypothetical protein